MPAAKYPPPGRTGSGSKGLSYARTCLAGAGRLPGGPQGLPPATPGGVAGGSVPGGQPGSRPWLGREPDWTRARLDQLWTVKSALAVAGVPSCTW